MFKIISFSFLIISFLLSCRAIKTIPEDYWAYQPRERPHMIAIFMDGTRDIPFENESWKNTNLKKIHSLAFDNIKSLYVEGVGARRRYIQAKNANTTRERIMRAYRFLAENYNTGDSICLFGFSRGANQCRILSSIIYTIGIINLDSIKEPERQPLLEDLYKFYIKAINVSDKRTRLARFLKKKGLDCDTSGTTMIELMGLWDTVEALKLGDRREITTPIKPHLNQLCNVKKLYHAMSLDDNRAHNYTPILATHKDVALHPGQVLDSIVEEVWFNGSHKDVGGGVRKPEKDSLPGISLTWMLSRLQSYHIFRETLIETHTMASAHNMGSLPFLWLLSPGDSLRGINKYLASMQTNRIRVHRSVIERLDSGVIAKFKLKKFLRARSDWYDWFPFDQCFIRDGKKRIFQEKLCHCIEVVNDSPPIK